MKLMQARRRMNNADRGVDGDRGDVAVAGDFAVEPGVQVDAPRGAGGRTAISPPTVLRTGPISLVDREAGTSFRGRPDRSPRGGGDRSNCRSPPTSG